MRALSKEVNGFATSLMTRGVLLAFLGISALAWPERAMTFAMLSASALLLLLGAYEIFLASRTRRVTPGWMIPMGNGVACVAFAILTLAFPGLSLNLTLLFVAIWLTFYGAFTAALALALWPMPRTRQTLILWTSTNLTLAILAVTIPHATIFTFMYVGAGYVIALGALHVASAIWIWRIASPRVAPVIQSSWQAPTRPRA
jgi:uncharacterized membrane protein HdeD (DUF308 family)